MPLLARLLLQHNGIDPNTMQPVARPSGGSAAPPSSGGFWNQQDSDNAARSSGPIAKLIYQLFGPPGYGTPGWTPNSAAPAPGAPTATGSPAAQPQTATNVAPPSLLSGLPNGRSNNIAWNNWRSPFSQTYQQATNPGSAIGPLSGQLSFNFRNAMGLGTANSVDSGLGIYGSTKSDLYRKSQL